jgi:hypothetical protein
VKLTIVAATGPAALESAIAADAVLFMLRALDLPETVGQSVAVAY